jgi:uncharacterized membrane protein
VNDRRDIPAQRALAASTVALGVALACVLAFTPSLWARYLGTPLRLVGVSLVLVAAVILHWGFLALGVRRLGRPLRGWLALAVLLFPIGGAAALMLLMRMGDETLEPQPAH